jgi:hypothetical protein
MDIKISILEHHNSGYEKPLVLIFHGNYALELMIQKLLEKYYGQEVTIKVISILSGRA